MTKWIKVEDCLPPDQAGVLVYAEVNGEKIVAEGFLQYHKNGWNFFLSGEEYSFAVDVTHWMELPEPPK